MNDELKWIFLGSAALFLFWKWKSSPATAPPVTSSSLLASVGPPGSLANGNQGATAETFTGQVSPNGSVVAGEPEPKSNIDVFKPGPVYVYVPPVASAPAPVAPVRTSVVPIPVRSVGGLRYSTL